MLVRIWSKRNPSRSFREGNGNPLQYSCLGTPMAGGAWWAAVHGVAKIRTWLSDFPFPFHFHALEKEMAAQSSVLAWRIPGMGEPGGLPSMGLHRVGHDWSDLAAAAAAAAIHHWWCGALYRGHRCRALPQCHLWNWPSTIATTAMSTPDLNRPDP